MEMSRVREILNNSTVYGVVVAFLSYAVYYPFAYISKLNEVETPEFTVFLYNYGTFIGLILVSLGLSLNERNRFKRILIYQYSWIFWGIVTLMYLVDDLSPEGSIADQLVHTNKIIVPTILTTLACFVSYFWKKPRK